MFIVCLPHTYLMLFDLIYDNDRSCFLALDYIELIPEDRLGFIHRGQSLHNNSGKFSEVIVWIKC